MLVGVLLISAAGAAEKIQPFNVKTGVWETTTITTTGGMPIPNDLLSKLTPEQRARMEERMKTTSGGKTKTTTSRSCVTKDDLQKVPKLGLDPKTCTTTVISSTGTRAEVHAVCELEGIKGNGTMVFEALSTENVKSSGDSTATVNGQTINVTSNSTSKWLGSNCSQ
jgi:hypothetical protein